MRNLFILLLLCSGCNALAEQAKSLDELVSLAREERQREAQAYETREREFREARERQTGLVEQLRSQLATERKRGEDLKKRYADNESTLSTASNALRDKTGTLGELFGVARQLAKDAQNLLSTSLVSAEKPKRAEFPAQLAERKDNPSIAELEQLWLLLLDEMSSSGKVSRFKAAVTGGDGKEQSQEVVRVGTFNAVSNGQFLHYLPETGHLVELSRQPSGRFLALASELQSAKAGIVPMALDPSRGSILSLLVDAPGFFEHIQRAGVIGYVILTLGGIALAIVLQRFLALSRTARAMAREKSRAAPSRDNPIGRLRQAARDNANLGPDALASKLDQVAVAEVPSFRRLLPTLSVFATAAPLLGLLGTVAGMIETFQSMSLFGAGDPKLVSGGISLALVATELGLLVAIPILLLHSWLHGTSNRLVQHLEEEIAHLIAQREIDGPNHVA